MCFAELGSEGRNHLCDVASFDVLLLKMIFKGVADWTRSSVSLHGSSSTASARKLNEKMASVAVIRFVR